MKAYVITINPDHFLFKNTIRQIEKLNKFDYEVVDGVRLTDYKLFNDKSSNKFSTINTCAASHAHVKAITKSLEYDGDVIIVEDDIYFRDFFYEKFDNFINQINNVDFDMFHFYETRVMFRKKYLNIERSTTEAAHFYLINKNSKEKIINVITSENMVIDRRYSYCAKHNLINMWATPSQAVAQIYDDTRNSSRHGNKLFNLYRRKGIFVSIKDSNIQ